ncbi:MAG: hypothetical protein RL607_2385 [Bacteroidota bacterium]
MITLHFEHYMNASPERVWNALWDDANYQQWMDAFSVESKALTDWEIGSKVYFVTANGDGMESEIEECLLHQRIVFHHLHQLKDGKVVTTGPTWNGYKEKYELHPQGSGTLLTMSLDTLDHYADYFKVAFPKAFAIVQVLAEQPEQTISVTTAIPRSLETVWDAFTQPEQVVHWNQASPDWHCPKAVGTLAVGESFTYTMAAKDGSVAFDLVGIYDEIEPMHFLRYHFEDGRQITVNFDVMGDTVYVTQTFQPESIHPTAMQRMGWKSILESFKKHVSQFGNASM